MKAVTYGIGARDAAPVQSPPFAVAHGPVAMRRGRKMARSAGHKDCLNIDD
jgi:hypothetical protein